MAIPVLLRFLPPEVGSLVLRPVNGYARVNAYVYSRQEPVVWDTDFEQCGEVRLALHGPRVREVSRVQGGAPLCGLGTHSVPGILDTSSRSISVAANVWRSQPSF